MLIRANPVDSMRAIEAKRGSNVNGDTWRLKATQVKVTLIDCVYSYGQGI